MGETGFGAVEGHWRPPLAAERRRGMGMPRTVHPEGFDTDEVGETAEVGEPPEGDKEAVVVSTLGGFKVATYFILIFYLTGFYC
jgi:hypothetical protein